MQKDDSNRTQYPPLNPKYLYSAWEIIYDNSPYNAGYNWKVFDPVSRGFYRFQSYEEASNFRIDQLDAGL